MPQFGWNLDLRRCVGCHACTVACKSENNTSPTSSPLIVKNGKAVAVNYRFVHTADRGSYPTPQKLFVSMACNHCASPACRDSCPVNAISKNTTTGLVQINQTTCIGCRYCEWACPYGAPQFNADTNKVEKCTGCEHRVSVGLDPACVTTCSARALTYTTSFTTGDNGTPPAEFASTSHTKPSIKFI